MRDGDRVSYVGFPDNGLVLSDRGRVVSVNGESSHVLWATGARIDRIDLIEDQDLVVVKASLNTISAQLADSLGMGPLVRLAVRETLEETGEAGLLNALNDFGHLGGLAQIAEDALEFVASRLRTDEAFAEVLSQLDEPEGSSLVSLASSVLLRDAFSVSEEGL